jgi:hypothetical protein
MGTAISTSDIRQAAYFKAAQSYIAAQLNQLAGAFPAPAKVQSALGVLATFLGNNSEFSMVPDAVLLQVQSATSLVVSYNNAGQGGRKC